ncbi:uncharacterized protein BO95DRAFT_464824 [Aspergillus brunneoviolaceus CBS 621.78]|uniref:Uncharacterized protein n=1 Tax=Aspergillus brunneoviolaceus CBS 621.78 TaxID=1450534 RepID=A0ACD1G601_9EURO|nr:hypothetical protein BO95DRAFT_464824 [Aspergillus brunneoviolaceus CBS 621.78]RAH44583.1 hypothetical protein BO95DRAFT_464824 [Aspergillus brunneoviolaceus CBS 621.78]
MLYLRRKQAPITVASSSKHQAIQTKHSAQIAPGLSVNYYNARRKIKDLELNPNRHGLLISSQRMFRLVITRSAIDLRRGSMHGFRKDLDEPLDVPYSRGYHLISGGDGRLELLLASD